MKRPVRKRLEDVTGRIPRGPRGFFGEGNAAGGAGVGALAVVNTVIPSPFEAGYKVVNHNISRRDDIQVHTFTIDAAFRDIAESAAKYLSTPSNIDFVLEATEVTSIELIEEKNTFSTWRITVEVRQSNLLRGEWGNPEDY